MALSLSCSSVPSMSCSNCERSFTDAECTALGTAAGCSSSTPFTDTSCSPETRGCRFSGCFKAPACTANDGGQ